MRDSMRSAALAANAARAGLSAVRATARRMPRRDRRRRARPAPLCACHHLIVEGGEIAVQRVERVLVEVGHVPRRIIAELQIARLRRLEVHVLQSYLVPEKGVAIA